MMDIPRRKYIFDKISEIYRTAEEIESESDSYSDAFNDAQYIEEQANELDIELTRFFNELYSFLRDIKEGYGVDEEKLDLFLYALEEGERWI